MTYKRLQEIRQADFQKGLNNGGSGHLLPIGKEYQNLFDYTNSYQAILDYFNLNNIKLWSCSYDSLYKTDKDGTNVTRHLLSSQVACINHLFFIRNDKRAVLKLINSIPSMPVKFKNVLILDCDTTDTRGYISFEVVGGVDYLNEKGKRGEYATSVDAMVYALDENDERWLLPIEWKYTEAYEIFDLSIESDRDKPGNKRKGKVRQDRYCNLIDKSKQLKSLDNYVGSIYFQEPFYQLMRQTLLAECICNNPDEKVIPAQHFAHIHVCPKMNNELLNKDYVPVSQKKGMESSWRDMLTNQMLYHLIDSKDFLAPIASDYPDLFSYLDERYWR